MTKSYFKRQRQQYDPFQDDPPRTKPTAPRAAPTGEPKQFRCYKCKTEFNQQRQAGEYAVCPKCGLQDIVVAGDAVPRTPEPSDERAVKWGNTRQRDDLKPCPFCGTKAIAQGRLADNETEQQWRIQCGNPFCTVRCMTNVFASCIQAEEAWQARASLERKP